MLEELVKELTTAMEALDAAGIEPTKEIKDAAQSIAASGANKYRLTALATALDREYRRVFIETPISSPERKLWFDAASAAKGVAFLYSA